MTEFHPHSRLICRDDLQCASRSARREGAGRDELVNKARVIAHRAIGPVCAARLSAPFAEQHKVGGATVAGEGFLLRFIALRKLVRHAPENHCGHPLNAEYPTGRTDWSDMYRRPKRNITRCSSQARVLGLIVYAILLTSTMTSSVYARAQIPSAPSYVRSNSLKCSGYYAVAQLDVVVSGVVQRGSRSKTVSRPNRALVSDAVRRSHDNLMKSLYRIAKMKLR